MGKNAQVFITFEQFILDIGFQRPIVGKELKVLPRYVYLNRALDILLENEKVSINEIYLTIAEEQSISEEKVKEEMSFAIKQIFSRRTQKIEFTKIFEGNKINNVELFLRKVVTAYKKSLK